MSRAADCLSLGNEEGIGKLMREAQQEFDKYLAPCSPGQLGTRGSPILHHVLSLPEIQKFIYGGKGVGSQGDGSAQLVCRSREDREKAKAVLEKRGYICLDLDLRKTN